MLRKFLRLILLFIPLVYYYYSQKLVVVIVLIFLLPLILLEIMRFMDNSLRKNINRKLSFILKNQEEGRITGITFLFLGFFVVIKYFQKDVAIFALTIALIYDFFSYFGKLFGKIKIRGKTLEGALVSAIIVFFPAQYLGNILGLSTGIIISAVIAAPLIEIFLDWPDDNFTIPFFVACVAQFIKNSF